MTLTLEQLERWHTGNAKPKWFRKARNRIIFGEDEPSCESLFKMLHGEFIQRVVEEEKNNPTGVSALLRMMTDAEEKIQGAEIYLSETRIPL